MKKGDYLVIVYVLGLVTISILLLRLNSELQEIILFCGVGFLLCFISISNFDSGFKKLFDLLVRFHFPISPRIATFTLGILLIVVGCLSKLLVSFEFTN